MTSRIVSGIMFVMLLAGLLTLAFNIQPVKSEPKTWTVDDDGPADFSEIRDAITEADPADASRASRKHWSTPTVESFFENGLDTRLMDVFEASGKWDFGNEVKWGDFACVDDDSVELVVGLSDMRPDGYSELVDLIMSNGGELVNTVSMDSKIRAVVVDIPHGVMSTFVSEVEITGLSRYVEPNMMVEIDFVPNDPNWTMQWGPRIIEADYAWNSTMGDSSVLVAVIDTGIDWDHPDLVANYVPIGYDWVNNDTDPMDDYGHGTHCAGIIGAAINDSIGIAGLAQVGVMAEKGFDRYGSGSSDDLANAMVHAVDQGADILSNSWGGFGESALIYEAVKYAHDHGVLVIASAGNDASECKQWPAKYEEVVAVTATDKSDNPAWWTNFGDWVEVAAPGVNVFSTWWNDAYRSASGTSMSTPHVAGVAALIWSQFPNMTRDQVRAQLRYTADDLDEPGFDEYCGYGRVNARRAVEQALPYHDLALLCWEVPSILKPFDVCTINGTLLNFGASNESDISVRLLVNGSIAGSVFVSHLASGASTTISFAWSPAAEGKHNVTLHVEPALGEISRENNILFRYVIVRLLEVIMVPNDFSTIQKAINEASSGYTIRVKPGIYYEHIIIDESVALIGENRQTTIIDGYGIEKVVWVAASNVSVTEFTIQNGDCGIFLFDSHNNNISRNIITNNGNGIYLCESSNSTISGNNITNNRWGIELVGALHNIISGNNITENNQWGIELVGALHNIICGNNITENNRWGIGLVGALHNIISGNNIANNGVGILLEWSSNNIVYHNNFVDNSEQVDSDYSINVWDDGYPSGGNYWSDHVCTGNPSDGSQPYIIDADNIDHYPFQDLNGWLIPKHGPEAEFTAIPDTALTGEPIKFDGSASLSGWNGTHEMPILEYRWDFGDGNKTTTSTPIVYHSYKTAGNYYITLTVYALGAAPETDSTTKKVTITAMQVGGYSLPIGRYTTEKPLTLYFALIAILAASFTMIRRKTHKRTKRS